MKHLSTLIFAIVAVCAFASQNAKAQGWPANYGGVMLQGFYWDSYTKSAWVNLEKQADEFSGYFDLVWVPQSGKCLESSQVMGYTPYYYFNQNSSFGTEAELRSMIKTFKAKNIGTIADVVVNHHNTDGWFGFPAETYKGVTYQFKSTDIAKNDDGGKSLAEATREGVSLSSNNDEGADWDGCRDLDHKSTNVQNIIKAYVKFLKDDIGYTGFRYDMVTGFAGSHVADYNDAAGVEYCVGECWDSNSAIENWINATSKKSAAFDFQFRYNVRDAINGNNWSKLNSDNNLVHDADYRRYAVTFVENHDMQDRGTTSGYTPDAIKKDTLAANAYLLAMPGTPCVFYTHYLAYPREIKAMVDARKLAGITNQSTYSNWAKAATHYVNNVDGTRGKLIVVVGNVSNYSAAASYTKVLEGYHYAYYLSNATETAWVNQPSGNYTASNLSVKLTAVSATSDTKLVYTTDGTTPTASSKSVTSGSNITIPTGTTTLKVALLKNGAVDANSIITRVYTVKEAEAFEPYDITVYVNVDNTDWMKVYFHSWGDYRTGTTWPGAQITATTTVNGKKWYYQKYQMTREDDFVSFVFDGYNAKNSQTQTVDVPRVTKTSYFEISSTKDNGKFTVNDVTSTTGIVAPHSTLNTQHSTLETWYTLSGQRVDKPSQKGIYIHNGRKVIVK